MFFKTSLQTFLLTIIQLKLLVVMSTIHRLNNLLDINIIDQVYTVYTMQKSYYFYITCNKYCFNLKCFDIFKHDKYDCNMSRFKQREQILPLCLYLYIFVFNAWDYAWLMNRRCNTYVFHSICCWLSVPTCRRNFTRKRRSLLSHDCRLARRSPSTSSSFLGRSKCWHVLCVAVVCTTIERYARRCQYVS